MTSSLIIIPLLKKHNLVKNYFKKVPKNSAFSALSSAGLTTFAIVLLFLFVSPFRGVYFLVQGFIFSCSGVYIFPFTGVYFPIQGCIFSRSGVYIFPFRGV